MKKILALITLCLMCVGFCFPVVSMAAPPMIVDEANVLTDSQEAELSQKLSEASARYKTDIAAVFVNGINEDITTYTDKYILNNGYGQGESGDAILFLVDLNAREYHISTHGETIYAFTDAGHQELDRAVEQYLRNDDYAGAADEFCETAVGMIDYKKQNGVALYQDTEEEKAGNYGIKGVISVIIGLIGSFAITGSMKKELKSVRTKLAASDYFSPSNLKLTGQKETFLYNTITRIPINNEPKGGGGFSTHTTGGSTFGGSGGKF